MRLNFTILYFMSSSLFVEAHSKAEYRFYDRVIVELGKNIGSHVQQRIKMYLESVENCDVTIVDKIEINNYNKQRNDIDRLLLVSLGNSPLSSDLISESSLKLLPAESYRLIWKPCESIENCEILVSNGLPLSDHIHKNISFDRKQVNYGAVTGSYASLEFLGFLFHHPLEPFIPPQIRVERCQENLCRDKIDMIESPHWPERAFHVHTQHPLELTEVFQGHDIPQFGPHGSSCERAKLRRFVKNENRKPPFPSSRAGHTGTGSHKHTRTYCERWEDMLPDVDYFFEWAVANRQNKIEWLLLGNYKWGDELATRQRRLRVLTGLGHEYGLLIGADVPIGNKQQHGWHMVNVRLPFHKQVQQIRERVDWLFDSGFDFLSTESGMSEFTHPECDLMVDLMNAFTEHVNGTWGREAGIKVHCSTGQSCENYPDPRTGDPLNFNFLPTYAHPGLAVFPHTVQVYALDDPTAWTYGNENFSYVEDYLVYEGKKGLRSVLFYGETAYWVNVDIDVPLFVPLYGQRRLHDLRRIAVREIREDFKIHGQMNFDSGWEWGYWLSDLVTARAVWNPLLPEVLTEQIENGECGEGTCDSLLLDNVEKTGSDERTMKLLSDRENKQKTLKQYLQNPQLKPTYEAKTDQWESFSRSLNPITKIFGPSFGPRVNSLLVELCQKQEDLLIFGRVQGKESRDLKKLSGFPYLSGGDTWVDVPRKLGVPFTQPDKVHLRENTDPDWDSALSILQEMDITFKNISKKYEILYNEVKQEYLNPSAKDNKKSISPQNDHRKYIKTFIINEAAILILDEINDCLQMLSMRASQINLLYKSQDLSVINNLEETNFLHEKSREILKTATEIVQKRENEYKVPWERIASWRENPTVYRFGYLWSVHSLYYWWRDQGLAEKRSFQSEHSPCYLNRMDTSEVAMGWGKATLEILRTFINRYTPFSAGYPWEVVNCLSPPSKEYEFPRDLYQHS